MITWLFTPVHSVIKMTPLTCATTAVCLFLGLYLPWVTERFIDGIVSALGLAVVIGFLNMGLHELYHRGTKK